MKLDTPYGELDIVELQLSPGETLPRPEDVRQDAVEWQPGRPDVRPEKDGVALVTVRMPYAKLRISGIRVAAGQSMREAIARVIAGVDFSQFQDDIPHIGLTSLVEGLPVSDAFNDAA